MKQNALLILLVFVCSFYLPLNCQNYFYTALGDAGADIPYSVITSNDSNYITTFSTASAVSGDANIALVKVDDTGAILWKKVFGGSQNDFPRSVIQTNDGGYAIFGSTFSYGSGDKDYILIKTDGQGNLEWTKTYGGADQERGFLVRQTPDGGFILGGSTVSGSNGFQDPFIIKTDPDGNAEWETSFGGFTTDNCFSIKITEEGDYMFTGSQGSFGPGNFGYWIGKISSSGQLLWLKTYGGFMEEHSRIIEQTNDGNYIVFGHTNTYGAGNWDFFLIKIDPSGNLLWAKTYGGSQVEFAGSIVKKNNGHFLLVGHTASFGNGGNDIALMEIDQNGALQWARAYGGPGNDDLPFGHDFGATLATDNNIILTGKIANGPIGDSDVLLAKLDASGQHNCLGTDFIPFVSQPTDVEVNNLSLPTNDGVSVLTPFLASPDNEIQAVLQCVLPIADFQLSDTIICQGSCIDLTDLSMNNPTDWSWSFQSGNPGMTNLPSPPNICFNTAGTYPLTLIVNNDFGADTLVREIEVLPLPEIDLGPDTIICEGASIVLDANTPGVEAFLWQDGSDLPTQVVTDPGLYEVVGFIGPCISSDEIMVSAENSIENIALGADTSLCIGSRLILDVTAPNSTYLWQDNSSTPTFEVATPGIYSVTVNHICGTFQDDIIIEYEDCSCDFYIPNAFSPNKDGINDIYRVLTDCPEVESFRMQIYSRWGSLVFESTDIATGWDGKFNSKDAVSDVFVYVIQYSYRLNSNIITELKSGDVILLR